MPKRSHGKLPADSSNEFSRRDFLKVAGVLAAGSLLAGCGVESESLERTPTGSNNPATPAPTSTSVPATAVCTPYTGPRPQVALAQATSYDRKLIRQQVQGLFDNLGGLKDIVSRGDKIGIKVNLTGGTGALPAGGETPTEYHILHPEVVRAVGELLRDSGARELYIVEAVSDAQSFPLWGYTEVAESINAKLIDLNQKDPYPDFATVPVGPDWFIYEKLMFNRLLQDVDAFVSIAKMKSHCSAGVTLSMKNLVGLVPMKNYQQNSGDGHRSAFHGTETGKNTRLPRVIVDLNRARPIHLSVIDGVITAEGGEGPWNIYTKQVKPGVLLAGKNALATDAVATSIMGFDPTSEAPAEPFLQSDNYLNLASQMGLGTNRLNEIDTLGAIPTDVRFPFAACREW
jgi:uncharacterized protein (DUF362 family)